MQEGLLQKEERYNLKILLVSLIKENTKTIDSFQSGSMNKYKKRAAQRSLVY
jgi:hypothetical protein